MTCNKFNLGKMVKLIGNYKLDEAEVIPFGKWFLNPPLGGFLN